MFTVSNKTEVITFGCRLNIYESAIIKQNVEALGEENILVFNTCAVTKEAEKQAKQAIRRAKKQNPQAKIIVTGCAAQYNPESFSAMEQVDKIIGNEEKLLPASYILDENRILVNDIMSIKETAGHLVNHFEGKTRSFLQIQNGCNHRCTFCMIPLARGNSRSVPIGQISQQLALLNEQGYQEVVFTGVDITDYGKDLPAQPSIAQMIKRILNLHPWLKRLRLSSIDVAEIDDELFELMAFEPRLMPNYHISLQSGDDMILKRMGRRHNRQQVIDFCHKLRDKRAEVSYGADIIAGFPTESQEMFENTKNLINQAGLQFLHVFPYSEREETPASKMPQVPKPLRKSRAAILRTEGQKQLREFLLNQLGQEMVVLTEENGYAHTNNFIKVKLDRPCQANHLLTVKLDKIVDDNQVFATVL